MRPKIKRDWEIIRIFLILAVLTVLFVWGVQSLILTPTGPSHAQLPAQQLHTEASLGKLGIITLPDTPTRQPASPLSEEH